MTFLRSSRLPVLALGLLLLGFAGTTYGAVRWDVVPSPTEVITYGRSEVLGGITLISRGTTNVTGTSNGGAAQIGIIFTNPALQIDNTTTSGIKLFWPATSPWAGLPVASQPSIVLVENFDLNGRCTGRITINIPFGVTLPEGTQLGIQGVRGRIDQSLAITAGTDLFADLQSINDPSANLFTPDRVRVAKSLCPMIVSIKGDTLLLCFPSSGKVGTATPSNSITITEGFARAFVDANSNGNLNTARVDSGAGLLGAPTNNTQFLVWLQDIPASVKSISWPTSVGSGNGVSFLVLVASSPVFDTTTGTASAIYTFVSNNQTDISDIQLETFVVQPTLTLNTGATATGTVNAGVYLYPFAETATACAAPAANNSSGTALARPRFLKVLKSLTTCNNPPDDPVQPYASIIRCNCYLLFTYVTFTPTTTPPYNTGIAIANTSGDEAVFGTNDAPNQLGKINFYFYDKAAGYVGTTVTAADILPGKSFVDVLSNILPTGVTSFSGYVFARADFQFCHGFAFIADNTFGAVAHGYLANVVPDPAIKNISNRRAAVAAGDAFNIPAGESLNN